MDYDFSGLCADQLEILRKRLNTLHKKFMTEYMISLNVINNENANDHRDEIINDIIDIQSDLEKTVSQLGVQAANKIQAVLKRYL